MWKVSYYLKLFPSPIQLISCDSFNTDLSYDKAAYGKFCDYFWPFFTNMPKVVVPNKFWKKVLLFLTMTSTSSWLRWVSNIHTMSWNFVAASNFSVWSLLAFFANPLRLYKQIRKEEMVFFIQEENWPGSFNSPTWFFWVLIYFGDGTVSPTP